MCWFAVEYDEIRFLVCRQEQRQFGSSSKLELEQQEERKLAQRKRNWPMCLGAVCLLLLLLVVCCITPGRTYLECIRAGGGCHAQCLGMCLSVPVPCTGILFISLILTSRWLGLIQLYIVHSLQGRRSAMCGGVAMSGSSCGCWAYYRCVCMAH